jgi:hypothetical protein
MLQCRFSSEDRTFQTGLSTDVYRTTVKQCQQKHQKRWKLKTRSLSNWAKLHTVIVLNQKSWLDHKHTHRAPDQQQPTMWYREIIWDVIQYELLSENKLFRPLWTLLTVMKKATTGLLSLISLCVQTISNYVNIRHLGWVAMKKP